MVRLVAFLRGINVGGRIVTKDKLQAAFCSIGFTDVFTYKQSGNVIFEASESDILTLRGKIEDKLESTLGYEVPVFVRTFPQLHDLVQQNYFKNQKTEGASFLVTLLSASAAFPFPLPLTIPKSTAEIIAANGMEVFSVTHGGGEGALPNPYIEKVLKTKATTRNLNIITEIITKYS